jgi:hypothetical protein
MGSVSSTGDSTLLQMLSAVSPQLSTMLSATTMQSALEASPADLVHLSAEALQLQQVDILFGNGAQSAGSAAAAEPDPMLQALESSYGVAGGQTTSTSITSPLADQIASARAQQIAVLFGTPTPGPSISSLG